MSQAGNLGTTGGGGGTVTSVSGTLDRITISGTATDPIVDIAATYVGQASITTLGTITTGVWNGTLIDVAHGGTGRNTLTNHGVLIGAAAGAINQTAAGLSGQVLQSGGAAADPLYSTATYPSTAGTAGKILISDGTNIISSTATFPSTAGATGTILRSDGTNWVATTSTYPNTNAVSTLLYASASNVMSALTTANNGTLVTSNTGVPSILAGPVTTGNILQSNAAAAPSFSTSTYPSTNAVSTLLYASSANVMSALATANNGLLVTSNTGVPSILAGPAATGRILQSNAAAAPSFSTATYPSTATSAGKVLIADGTNWVASTPTYPNASATAGKILISDGTNFVASTPTYPNASATSGKILISDGTNFIASTPTYPNASAATGKFLISDGTNFIASTPTIPNTAGTSGKVLVSDGTNFVSSTPTFPNASATSRKIIVSDGTNWVASTETYAVPGTSGNVMKSDGTNWTSSTASGVGAWVIIQSQAASNSATIDFTTGINAGTPYVRWVIDYRAVVPASDGSSLRMQISTNSGSSWVATNYTSGENSIPYNSTTLANLNSTTNFYVSALLDNGAATSMGNGFIHIYNIASQATYIHGTCGQSDSSGATAMVLFAGKCTTSGANAFRMIMSTGNITSGTFTLYGLLES